MEYNIYSDESCHLENDHIDTMLFGAIMCPKEKALSCNEEIRELKKKFGCNGELKWSKVSKSRRDFYIELIHYFFKNENLRFRSLIVKNKHDLNHNAFNEGSHDTFYYKMYYYLVSNWSMCCEENQYDWYLDIKDTKSIVKVRKLKEILAHKKAGIVKKIQHVRSNEIELLQLADFILGAISYNARGLEDNKTKLEIINSIRFTSRLNINHSTPPWLEKFNLFYFYPEVRNV